jgi:hypothetical protein
MDLVEMVNAFIAQVVDIVTTVGVAYFVTALERTTVFHVTEKVIRTAMTAMEQVS